MRVMLKHAGPLPNSRWCEPAGWRPKNKIDGATYVDGSWWDDQDKVAGLTVLKTFGDIGCGRIVDVELDELVVVSCGDCHVIGRVES